MSKSSRTWWAPTAANARRTAIGAIAIGLCLAIVSFFVWNSPGSPISPAATIARAETSAVEQRLVDQRAELLASVVELRSQLATAQATLRESGAQSTKDNETIVALSERVAAAERAAASAGSGESNSAPAAKPSTPKPSTTKKPTPSATPAPIVAPAMSELVDPESRYFGLYTSQAPFNFATYDDTATKIGASPNVVGYFGGWDEAFRPTAVTAAWKRDTMPILTWESRPIGSANDQIIEPDYELPDILAGNFDDYIHQYAKDIVATGLPLGIRFNHEMNGVWYPWAEVTGSGAPINGNSPGQFVEVWKHVHEIFEQEGANDLVAWIWSPNIINNLPKTHKTPEYLAALYPGDEYVDWVGLSGYLRPPYKEDQTFSFDYTFEQSLDQLRNLTDKPIFLAEIGASETGGHKVKWIESLFAALAKPENEDIIGFAWFNLAITSYVEGERATNDWRIDSRADSLAAFTKGITNPATDFALVPKVK